MLSAPCGGLLRSSRWKAQQVGLATAEVITLPRPRYISGPLAVAVGSGAETTGVEVGVAKMGAEVGLGAAVGGTTGTGIGAANPGGSMESPVQVSMPSGVSAQWSKPFVNVGMLVLLRQKESPVL